MDWQNGAALNQNLGKLSDEEKFFIKNHGHKISAGMAKREDKDLPAYIFWCPDCENFSYDCPRGSLEEQHLICHRCGEKIDFSPWWAGLKRELKSLLAWLRGLENHAEG